MDLRDQTRVYWRFTRQYHDAARAFGLDHQLVAEALDELDTLAKWTDFEPIRVACLKFIAADAERRVRAVAL
jgi:hypothetical protein